MGIPSLNSAILYCIRLYFHYKDPSLPLRMTPKSCKYNKYPEPHPRKHPFLWIRHNNPKWPYQWKSAKLRQSSQINWNLSIGDEGCSMSCKECTVKYSIAYSD